MYEKFIFPNKLSGVDLRNVINNEVDSPGLGVSAIYAAPGINISIYIYNKQIDSIPDDLNSEVVWDEFQEAGLDIYRAHPGLDSLIPAEVVTLSGVDCLHGFYAFSDPEVGRVYSHLLLSSMRGEFLKFRMSYLDGEYSEVCFKSCMYFAGEFYKFMRASVR